jgi:hypothetical protein
MNAINNDSNDIIVSIVIIIHLGVLDNGKYID